MASDMPANLWKLVPWIRLTNIVLLLLLAFAQGRSSDSRSQSLQECRRGTVQQDHIFKAGKRAGNFTFLKKATSVEECKETCCGKPSCQVALFLKDKNKAHGRCYAVECRNTADSCDTIPVSNSRLVSSIFKRNLVSQKQAILQKGEISKSTVDSKYTTLIREKRHISCHHYHGHTCGSYLEKRRLLYFDRYPPSVEKDIASPFRLIKDRLSRDCKEYALAAICVSAFPYCSGKSKPKPNELCRKDCDNLYSGVCVADFKTIKDNFKVLAKVLPDCDKLPITGSPEAEDCIKLGVPEPVSDLDNDENLMTGTATDREHDEETSDAGGVVKEQALNLFRKTTKQGKPSTIKTGSPQTIQQQLGQTDTVLRPGMPTDSDVSVDRSNSSFPTPSRIGGRPGQQESKVVGNGASTQLQTERDEVQEEIGSLEEKSDAENYSGRDKIPESRTNTNPTAAVPPDLRQEQSDSSTTRADSEPLAANSLSSSKDNRSQHLKESLGILDPVQTTSVPHHTSPFTVGSQGQNSSASTVASSSVSLKTGVNESATGKGDKTLSWPTAASPTASHVTTTSTTLNSLPREKPTAAPTRGSSPSVFPVTQKGTTIQQPTTAITQQANSTHSMSTTQTPPTLVIVNSSRPEPEANFAESSENETVTSQPKKEVPKILKKKIGKMLTKAQPTTPPPLSLHVSAGNNKQIVLPANTVSLYASAWPKETQDRPYSYHWQQISAPDGSHGYMQGQETKQVTLTQLDKPGVYQFKVKVTGPKHAIGAAYVNVTVKPAPRVNKPPRADISPREQSITLPTNEVVLDGRKSSDDDKIVQYKWEEVKGPLNDKNKVISSGSDTPILQLKSLVPGVYTFKLTVVDSDGLTDSTTATVTVNNEKDYPPVARAGHDVVLTLPLNSVTLHGNSSTDDKGIASYEWSKSPTSPAVGDMQGTTTAFLKVSNLVVGDYTFILKVTDKRGQSDSTKVTVVVQPEKNEPPVAKAGSDKDLVFPDDTTTLDAKDSHDDQKIVKYQWEQIQGPAQSEMIGTSRRVVTLKKLQEGHYVFKLTVTDEKGLSGHDEVAVNVKKGSNYFALTDLNNGLYSVFF